MSKYPEEPQEEDWWPNGLYRSTTPLKGSEERIPADVLVFLGRDPTNRLFVVRPDVNEMNQWRWRGPVLNAGLEWLETLLRLPPEGFYILPEAIVLDGIELRANAIVQLGYDTLGNALVFVAERRSDVPANALFFGSSGLRVNDDLLFRLVEAPTAWGR